MRDMPAPGEEDTGGNPLQEGVLGDFQNRGVRDEAFASVEKPAEPDFEVVDVLPPDPDSIRSDKKQMDKQTSFLDTLGDIGKSALPIAGGIAGGAVGALTLNPAGVAAGAAIGSGLGGAAEGALNGESAGGIVGQGLEDGALGGISGGLAGGAAAGLAGGVGDAAAGMGAASLGTSTAEEAAANGMTKGGVGSLMKSAWGKIPTGKIQNAYMMHQLMGDAGNQMQQATTPNQNMVGGPANPSIYSAVETPTSHGEIPSNDTSDPEEVDFHENEDKKNPLSEMDINGIGGTDQGPDNFFSPDSGALSSFAEMLPKILELATSDQSAAGDPDMEDLHQKLEAEAPGYMNQANDDDGHKLMVFIMGGGQGGGDEASGDESLQDNDKPHDPISEHEATALRPGLENTCPNCGGVTDPSTGHCPQCGAGNMMHQPQPTNPDINNPMEMQQLAHTAAGMTQGPNTDQQKAEVAELLQQEGRGEEIPTMLLEPWNYADELSKITQQEQPPESIGQEGPPPPVPPQQPGEMPVPGMSGGPEGAMGQQMAAAVSKYAASVDGFCEHCPKCGGHSTGYLDYEAGKAGCKTCGNTWDAPKMVKSESHVADVAEEHLAAGEDMAAAPMTPELSQAQPEQEQEQNGSLSWTDESGSPLKVGQTYEMYSQNYDIPDRITVTAVKPDVIEYTINGEYGLSHQSELTHQEAQVEGDRFVPADAEQMEQAPEENQGAQPMDPPPGQQTDLSTPHEFNLVARTADFDDSQIPGLDSAGGQPPMPPGMDNDVTQRDTGQANRLAQMLMKEGFPQAMAEAKAVELMRGLGQHEMNGVAEDIQAAPEVPHPMGPTASTGPRTVTRAAQAVPDDPIARMGSAPALDSHQIGMMEETDATSRAAINQFFEDAPDLGPVTATDNGTTGPDWLMEGVRTAGAHMSPYEQRHYIDESGDARNSDKLQLSGTHYEMDDLSDSFLFGDAGL